MVKVRGGMRSDDRPKKTSQYRSHLAMFDYKGVMLSHSDASKIESGKYLVMLTAVARQCTMYRSVILNSPPTEKQAEIRLKKWAKILPIKHIR